jgi:hypothetical protein
VLPTLPIAALRKSFQTIEFFFSPAFQPRLQILREALVFLKEETAWKLVDINYLQVSAVTAIALKTCSLNHPGGHTCCRPKTLVSKNMTKLSNEGHTSLCIDPSNKAML